MTDNKDDKTSGGEKRTLTLKPLGVQTGTVRQDMGRGRTKAVVVETRKRRFERPGDEKPAAAPAPVAPVVVAKAAEPATPLPRIQPRPASAQQPAQRYDQQRRDGNRSEPQRTEYRAPDQANRPRGVVLNDLSAGEIEARRRALAEAQVRDADDMRRRVENDARRKVEDEARMLREKEEAEKLAAERAAYRAAHPDEPEEMEASGPQDAPSARAASPSPASPGMRRTEGRAQAGATRQAPVTPTPATIPTGVAPRNRKVDTEEDDERGSRGAGPARGKVVRPEPAKAPRVKT
ncbi:MAG: hypothetical protein RIR97_122, partial [Pseudomonadota bacterium]